MSTHEIVKSEYAVIMRELTLRVRTSLRPSPGCKPCSELIIHHTIGDLGIPVSLSPVLVSRIGLL